MGRIIGIFLGCGPPPLPVTETTRSLTCLVREIPYKILQQETTPKVSPTKNDDASWLEGGTQGRSVYYTARFIFLFVSPSLCLLHSPCCKTGSLGADFSCTERVSKTWVAASKRKGTTNMFHLGQKCRLEKNVFQRGANN